jgi:flavin reductase (DIM6/NTAB) family NADH-FMN oxidoreductase RutF
VIKRSSLYFYKEERKIYMRKEFGVKAILYPQPVLILASYDLEGNVWAMNAAWGGISEENEISVCLTPTHKTIVSALKQGSLTISPGTAKEVAACDYVGIATGNKDADKMKKSGWHFEKAPHVNAPIIKELPMTFECKIKEFNTDTCIMKLEIVNVLVDDSVLTDGKIDLEKLQPIAFDAANRAYVKLTEKVGDAWKSGLTLM